MTPATYTRNQAEASRLLLLRIVLVPSVPSREDFLFITDHPLNVRFVRTLGDIKSQLLTAGHRRSRTLGEAAIISARRSDASIAELRHGELSAARILRDENKNCWTRQ